MMCLLDFFVVVFTIKCLVAATDLPCSPRPGEPGQGQICVCNSTYCDTIERPNKLPLGQYHLYTTSNSTPGFTHTTGHFTSESENDPDYDILFSINNTIQYQEIIGIGGSFSDSAGIVINSLPSDAQDKLIETYFGTSGIEYTLCRTTIGGSDFSGRSYYTLDDVPYDGSLNHFSLTQEDYVYKIPFIQKAQSVSERGIKLYGCAWNSPQWMKTSYTDPRGGAGYIRNKYLQTYAQYHVKFIEEYKENGINIWGVSGGNEVVMGFMVGLNCTQQLAHIQRDWLKNHLSPALISANLSNVKFLGMDDMRLYAVYWMDRFADDPEAYKLSAGIALHWYLDFTVSPILLDIYHLKHPEQMIVYTESSINPFFFSGPAIEFGSWGRAAVYMHNIIENLNHWTNGYIDWNLALNVDGGPYLYIPLDAAVIVNNITGEFYKQPSFYALGHFSKLIPPGSRRVHVEAQNSTSYSLYNEDNISIEKILEEYELFKVSQQRKPHFTPTFGNVTAPEVVECVATSNSDGSNTIIVLNNKNITSRVKLDIASVGTVTLNLEEKSLNTFVYWI